MPIDDELPVDELRQGLADAHVLERIGLQRLAVGADDEGALVAARIEGEVDDAGRGDGRQPDALRRPERVFTSPGGTASMRSTAPERRAATRAASLAMNLIGDVLEVGLRAPVLFVADERDVVARHPFLHLVGPGADRGRAVVEGLDRLSFGELLLDDVDEADLLDEFRASGPWS